MARGGCVGEGTAHRRPALLLHPVNLFVALFVHLLGGMEGYSAHAHATLQILAQRNDEGISSGAPSGTQAATPIGSLPDLDVNSQAGVVQGDIETEKQRHAAFEAN